MAAIPTTAAIPTEVIFVLIFLAFSILEGVGRKRKAQERKERGEGAPLPPSREPRAPGQTPSADRSTASPREGAGRVPVATGRGAAGADAGTSEGMIPKDVWEEILGLARGTPSSSGKPDPGPDQSGAPQPRREDETLEEIPPFEARSLEPLYVEHDRVTQRSRDMVTTGTSGPESLASKGPRGGGRGKGRGTAALGMSQASAPAATHRRRIGGSRLREDLFGEGAPEDLRRAVVLREVLGPPVAIRDHPGEGRGE
jgi:hypothetical protein